MAVLNYAQQYSKELAQAYPYVLYSGALETILCLDLDSQVSDLKINKESRSYKWQH